MTEQSIHLYLLLPQKFYASTAGMSHKLKTLKEKANKYVIKSNEHLSLLFWLVKLGYVYNDNIELASCLTTKDANKTSALM
jgi:hypothetical protein